MAGISTQVSLSALTAITISVLAATSASAADVVGKWYTKLDSEPVITINKAGPAYSASLDYPDTTRSVLMRDGMPGWPQSTHKDITRFEVAGNTVHFTIRNEISTGGPDKLAATLKAELSAARQTLLELAPPPPAAIQYEDLWPQILKSHIVRRTEVNALAAELRKSGYLLFPDWEQGKRVPQQNYRVQRAPGAGLL